MPHPALIVLANRRLAEREASGQPPVQSPDRWIIAVARGLEKDFAGRLATMPNGLGLDKQVKWLEDGPPAKGLRIPPPTEPLVVPELMPLDLWQQGIETARGALKPRI